VVIHHEAKEFQVEELVIDKGGSKLKETTWDPASPLPAGPPQRDNNGSLASPGQIVMVHPAEQGTGYHIVARAQPILQLTNTLGGALNCPVLDKTGLTGKYDYTVDYTIEQGAGPSEPRPDIAAAVQQQLGLRLVPGKAMIDVVIVDKAEKVPTAN
jgi:uncharacterized protein (TIGR03435 family)